jgi:hypothetical protein
MMSSRMRWAILGILVTSTSGVCYLAGIAAADTPKIFRSGNGAFQFRYAPELVRCETQDAKVTPGSTWAPVEACRCNDPGGAAVTAVCFAYPKAKFKDKPVFHGASFFVATDAAATDAQSCFAGSASWGDVRGDSATIGATAFQHFRVSDAGMSHYSESDIYRGFHAGTCYELVVQEMTTNPAVYDSGTIQEFTKEDDAEVMGTLTRALRSFQFVQ